MNKTTKILAAVIAIAIVLSAGLFFAKENSAKKTPYLNTGINPQEEVTIRYLSSSTIIEPYELAKELDTSKALILQGQAHLQAVLRI